MFKSYLFCLHSPENIIIRYMSSYFAESLLHAVPPFSELLFLSAPTEMTMPVQNTVPRVSSRRIIEQRETRKRAKLRIQVEHGVLDERDRETVYQLHVIMREQRKIFKVEEVKRKLKTVLRRLVVKTCGCCGRSVMKHKCVHSLCSQQTCSKYLRLLKYARRKLEEEAQGSERQVSQRGAEEDDNNSLNEDEDLEEQDQTFRQPQEHPEPLPVQEQSDQNLEGSNLERNDEQIQ